MSDRSGSARSPSRAGGSAEKTEASAARRGEAKPRAAKPGAAPREIEHGGPTEPEPTRYGDWERKGRCIDF